MIIGYAVICVGDDGKISLNHTEGQTLLLKIPVHVDIATLAEAEKSMKVCTGIAIGSGFTRGEDGLWRNPTMIGQMFHDTAEVADWLLRQKKGVM